jgi:hypothetical protein
MFYRGDILKLLGWYILDYIKTDVYLKECKMGFYCLISDNEILEWFIKKSSAIEFCFSNLENFVLCKE